MAKKYTWISRLPKFEKDPHKKYLRKYRIYPSFSYHRLDKWLNQMSLNGWHLVDSNLVSFLFEEGKPTEKIYFTYMLGPIYESGEYDLLLLYPGLEKTFGVKKKYSKLNKNEAKDYRTIETNTKKIDVERDIAYNELLRDRNRRYKKLAIKNFIFASILIILGIGALWIGKP